MSKPTAKRADLDKMAGVKAPGPLDSKTGRAWLAEQLATAKAELRLGPGGAGWLYNESKRAEAQERVALLEAIYALVTAH